MYSLYRKKQLSFLTKTLHTLLTTAYKKLKFIRNKMMDSPQKRQDKSTKQKELSSSLLNKNIR